MADAARVLDALGDGTRREVFELLAHGERSVAALTAALPVSQSAVSQHLRVLKDAGLVVDRAEGTRRLYRIDGDGLSSLRAYVDRFWDDVLESFAAFADGLDPAAEPPPGEPSSTVRRRRRPTREESR